MNWQETRRIATWLLTQCGVTEPIYLVDYHEARAVDEDLAKPDMIAWTSTACDTALAPYLKALGQWQGRGFAAVIDHKHDRPLRESLGIILHECAHFLTWPETAVQHVDQKQCAFALGVLVGERCGNTPTESVPVWHDHGADFIRAAAHLAHRASEHVESVRPAHVKFSQPYYDKSEGTFIGLLACEFDSQRPIREILATEPPERFTEFMELLAR